MPQQRPNFALDGDDTTGALRKLDNNCVDLDNRVGVVAQAAATAQSKADAAIPKSGGRVNDFLEIGSANVRITTQNGDASQLVIQAGYAGHFTYLQMGADGFFTINGARIWSANNTTVDANKFIKSV